MEKSECSFSQNVPERDRNFICNKMGVKTVESHDRYLGLPVPFGRSKKVIFSFVIDRVWKKLKGWKEKCLSRAGKEILIKAVAQAIPTYIMGCYKFPESCCNEIEAMLSRFWWGSGENERKIHWVSWSKMSKAKKEGGLGFREFSDFNKALLGKQCWRLITKEGTLVEKVFKSRYYPRGNFLNAHEGHQPSYVWRSILGAREVVQKGGMWLIGNGRNVRIWGDNWLPGLHSANIRSPVSILEEDTTVDALIEEETKQWNKDLIFSCFLDYEAKQIINIPLSFRLPTDRFIWRWEKDGEYSVRSSYHALCEDKSRNEASPSNSKSYALWSQIWKSPIPNKIKNHLWRVAKNILPVRCNLIKKGIQLDTICPLCHEGVENIDHMIMRCKVMKIVLFASQIGTHIPDNMHYLDWISHWLSGTERLGAQIFAVTLWKLWHARNQLIFKNERLDPIYIAEAVKDFVAEYNIANPVAQKLQENHTGSGLHDLSQFGCYIYVDAGVFDDGIAGWGMTIRNSQGDLIFAACRSGTAAADPTLAEAIGVRWCLTIAKERAAQNPLIVSDALVVVDCIKGKLKRATMEPVILDCIDLLSQFDGASVKHIRRAANVDAHVLVGLSRSLGDQSWSSLSQLSNLCSTSNISIVCNELPVF